MARPQNKDGQGPELRVAVMEPAFDLGLSAQWLELCFCLYELRLWTGAWTKEANILKTDCVTFGLSYTELKEFKSRISWEPRGSSRSAESTQSIFPLKVTFDTIYLQIPMGPLPPYLLSLANCGDLSSFYILFILVGEEGWARACFTKSLKHSF